MEVICKQCGFTNPESSHFCALCGTPFLSASPQANVHNVRSPSKQAGTDSGEVDYDSVLHLTMTSGSRSRASLEKPAVKASQDEEDDLDSLLSDFDGTFPNLPDDR